MLDLLPSGHKSWIVHRRRNGSVVRRTLWPFDALTVEDARHAARAVIAEAEAGDASGVGELGAGSDVVADEARRDAGLRAVRQD